MLYGLIILASFLWGSNVLVMRYMLEYTSSYFLATLKVALSLIVIYGLMKYKKIFFKRYPLVLVLKVSMLVVTINFILTFAGLNLIAGSSNAIINSLSSLVTIILARLFYQTNITKRQMSAMMIAIIAFLISLNFNVMQLSLGHLLMLGGIIVYSLGNLIMQQNLKKDDNLAFTFQYLLFSLFQLIVVTIIMPNNNHFEKISIGLWLLFILFSGIGFAIIQLVYFKSIQEIGSVKTSFLLGLNPIFTYLGSLILGEPFDFKLFLAMVLMIISMVIVNKKPES